MKTELYTYLEYQQIFAWPNFFIPNKKLLKRERVTDKIINLFECYNLDELLILISYVNSVCYSEDTEKIIATQKNDLEKYWITKFYNKSILYNQASLVNLLQIILSNNFLFINKRNIFWTKYFSKHIKLLQWFLLSNNLNALNWEKEGIAKHIIREYSPSYQKELFVNITNNRIDRYKHLLSTSCENKDFQEAFNKFVESIWISNMNSYITAIESFLAWFTYKFNEFPYWFQKENLNSFLVRKINFENSDIIKILKYLSFNTDNHELKEILYSEDYEKSTIRFLQRFPIYETKTGDYCILDLWFLLDKICFWLFHIIDTFYPDEKIRVSSLWWKEVENIFNKTITNLINWIAIAGKQWGSHPDAYIEYEESIFIFEFTTEYYYSSSLYINDNNNAVLGDLRLLLFNKKWDSKHKNSPWKAYNLSNYNKIYNPNKEFRAVPILVTERYIWDIELLQLIPKFKNIEKEFNESSTEFKSKDIIIICLDDLEFADSIWCKDNNLLNAILEWSEIKNERRLYQFRFRYYLEKNIN